MPIDPISFCLLRLVLWFMISSILMNVFMCTWKKMCILLLLDGVLCKCQLGQITWMLLSTSIPFMIFDCLFYQLLTGKCQNSVIYFFASLLWHCIIRCIQFNFIYLFINQIFNRYEMFHINLGNLSFSEVYFISR